MTLFAQAQTVVKEMDNADTRFIPGQYMKNGEAAIYFSSNEYGYSDGQTQYEAQIFDFELKPLKSFYFQILHPYTVTESRAATGSKELIKVLPMTRGEIYGLPDVSDMEARKNAFVTWFYDSNKYQDPTLTLEGIDAACRIDGTTIYITLAKNDYFYIPYPEYLKTMEAYFDSNNIYGTKYTYSVVVPVCNGEWSKSTWYDVPVSNFCTPRCTDVASMNHWNGGVYLPFSQTFFNDDEKFEYVRYKADIVEGYGASDNVSSDDNALRTLFRITENDRDGDGEVDYRSTRYGVKRTGLEVVAEDGTVIYNFPVPETCEGNASVEFFKSDNHILAQVDYNWRDDDDKYIHTVRFYRIDKSAGVPKVIKEENHIALAPNPATKGMPVEITLPSTNASSRSISVTSLNGSNIYSASVDPSATKATLPTSNFASGVYMLSVIDDGRVVETSKIIIR